MDGLRWILLLIGALVIAGVYWYSRRESTASSAPSPQDRREPQLDTSQPPRLDAEPRPDGLATPAANSFEAPADLEIPEPAVATQPDPAPAAADSAPASEPAEEAVPREKIVALRLVASRRSSLPGDELALALRKVGMRHGKFGIFHRYVDDDEDRVLFSAASLVEPGSFDLANLKDQQFPGISLFMVLPGPLDGAEAFDELMAASRQLAQSLGAELLDETGSTLSIQRERYMREEIIQHQLGIKVA